MNIKELLPQKDRMALLDAVVPDSVTKTGIKAQVTITEKTLFYDPKTKHVPVWIGIEYMAQTIAAFSNIPKPDNPEGSQVSIGLLLGARKYACHTQGFPLGQNLTITVDQLYYDNNLASFDCQIHHDKTCLATAQVNVFHPDSLDQVKSL